ncbi:TPA: hypothetical protein DCE37_13665 [Candidatus Latescibacteria bacterium]|nr:hypothetical protein [Candidatus Latescibacterota bacterium]
MNRSLTIIGGGFSGIAAAVRAAEAGKEPLLLERRPFLGGRAYSFSHDNLPYTVDNGQHVLMRCCTHVIDLLEKIGADEVSFQAGFRIPFLSKEGTAHILSAPSWLPTQLGLFVAFARYSPAGLSAALGLRRVQRDLRRPPTGVSVADWLKSSGQTDRIQRSFWIPLCHSVMNASPEDAPADELLTVLSEAFGTPSGAAMGWATTGLTELCASKARAFIESRGGQVRSSAFVTEMTQETDQWSLDLRNADTVVSKRVILAVPPLRAADLLGHVLPDLANLLTRYTPSPILGINLWFDRPIMNTAFVGFLDGSVEWVFDRQALTGQPSEHGYHYALVTSASSKLLEHDDADLVDIALDELRSRKLVQPDEEPVRTLVIQERQATYLRPLGDPPIPNGTDLSGLFLAGDWTDTSLPPTIEGAVRSGNRAADLALV